MNANELNLIDVAWTTGYVIGQLPSQLILTRIRPSIWIPSCELVWTILTFSIAACTSSNQVVAIRFFVGLTESIFYPAAHFLLGSWYLPLELGKRACIFHASAAAAGMFSGYLQAAVYKGLDGTLGKAGWQWLFVMDGLISAPICIAGFFLIPDLPENSRVFYLNEEDRELARKRMDDVGRAPRKKLEWSILKRVFTRWHVWGLTVLYIIFINTGPSSSVAPLALWLKATGWPITLIVNRVALSKGDAEAELTQNIIPTGQSAVQLVTTVTFAILSDFLRNRPIVMSISTVNRLLPQNPPIHLTNRIQSLGFLSSLCLAIWNIPSGLHWLSYFISRAAVPYGPLSMSWANEICGGDAEERALVLGIMNAAGYAFNAWLPLLTYPAKQAPRFKRGFLFSACAFVAQFATTGMVAWLWRWEKRRDESRGERLD